MSENLFSEFNYKAAMSTERESVVVKHVGSEDIEHHVNILGVKKKQRRTRTSCANLSAGFVNEVKMINKKKACIKSDVAGTDRGKKAKLPDDAKTKTVSIDLEAVTYSGAEVYAFKTPKRSKQMSKYAAESAKKIRGIQKSSKKENEEPKTATVTETTQLDTGTRQGMKFSVQKMKANAIETESTEESDSEKEESDEDIVTNNSTKSTMRIELPSETELYFEAHKAGRKLGASTSDRTLAKLKTLRMNREEMQSILEHHHENKLSSEASDNSKNSQEIAIIESARQRIIKRHTKNFRKWMFYMTNGYNILLYGLGSKRKLVHDFCEKHLKNHTKIIVNGYFPSLTIKSVLMSIQEEVLKETILQVGNQQRNLVDMISQRFSGEEDDDDHLFLVIHNIDGLTLRNSKAQGVLSQLADCDRIHIVATIDHINASLIWDQSKLCRYHWLWYDVTTYEPYSDETSYEDSLLLLTNSMGVGGSLALSGLVHVARSLTPNARGIFLLIVKFQMEESKENEKGLAFSDLYQQCRESFLVNSELTLRSQLTEFLDHKLVQIRKGGDGGEYLYIPLDNSTLQEYLEQVES